VGILYMQPVSAFSAIKGDDMTLPKLLWDFMLLLWSMSFADFALLAN